MERYLVVGLGNLLLSDDAAGPLAVRRAAEGLPHALAGWVDFQENYSGGFDLLELMVGYKRVVLVDSICTGTRPPGTCRAFSLETLEVLAQSGPLNSHGLNLPMLMDLGTRLGYAMPEEVQILGVEASDVTTFSETLTGPVEASVETVVNLLHQALARWQTADGVGCSGSCL